MTRIWMRIVIVTLLLGILPRFATENAIAQTSDKNPPTKLVNLQFGGGTIAEYLDTIRKETGYEVNIVLVDPRAGEPRLPAIELKGVAMIAAVHLVEGEYPLEDGTVIGVIVENLGGRGEQQSNPLFRVYGKTSVWEAPSRVRVWSLSGLIDEELTAEDALTAVELAVRLVDTTSRIADVRFHEATSLLIANGTQDQIGAISGVIDRLDERRRARITAQEAAAHGDTERPIPSGFGAGAQPPPEGEMSPLREIERLTRLVDDQQKRIQVLESRLNATPK
jgi:hypothetical protein